MALASQDWHPVTIQAVDPVCEVIKRLLCILGTGSGFSLTASCQGLKPAPRQTAQPGGQSASISDFNPNSGLGLQARPCRRLALA